LPSIALNRATCVNDPVGRRRRWRRLFAVSHQHRDLSGEMLFYWTVVASIQMTFQ
jgi:hypothetical protein